MDFEGMTGRVHFGKFGLRDSFTLDIVELSAEGLAQVSTQNSILHFMIRIMQLRYFCIMYEIHDAN